MADDLIGADQKTPDWLIKITFLLKIQTAIRLGIKSKICIMGFSTSEIVLHLWFFSLTIGSVRKEKLSFSPFRFFGWPNN